MQNDRTPNYMLQEEVATWSRPTGQPVLRYEGFCKRDMKLSGINSDSVNDAVIFSN